MPYIERVRLKIMEIGKLITDFKQYLLNSPFKEEIAKIILFGSHAKGVATSDSDIDILIVIIDGLRIERPLMDRIYDFILEHNAPLEVVTAGVSELFLSQDYFLYNVIHHGVEVYSMKKDEIKVFALKDLRNLAEEFLDSAEEVLARNRIRLAIDAAYNAAELAAKALILLKQDDLPGSHGGVVSLFGQLYVKTDEIEKEVGRNLNTALRIRNEARYRPNALLTAQNALDILDLARRLIRIIDEKINEYLY